MYLGVDPGKGGAIARVKFPELEIFDWSGVIKTAAKLREWKAEYNIIGAFLEDVHNLPHDGGSSSFRFGKNVGAWEAILATLEIETKTISEKQWRKGIYKPGDRRPLKKRSLDAARGIFPAKYTDLYFSRQMDHDRAEAALIAYQAERFFNRA